MHVCTRCVGLTFYLSSYIVMNDPLPPPPVLPTYIEIYKYIAICHMVINHLQWRSAEWVT